LGSFRARFTWGLTSAPGGSKSRKSRLRPIAACGRFALSSTNYSACLLGVRALPAPSRSRSVSRKVGTHSGENQELRYNAVSLHFAIPRPYSTDTYLQAPIFPIPIGAITLSLCPDQGYWADQCLGLPPSGVRLIPAIYWVLSKSIICGQEF
jgi:hypothetical protein